MVDFKNNRATGQIRTDDPFRARVLQTPGLNHSHHSSIYQQDTVQSTKNAASLEGIVPLRPTLNALTDSAISISRHDNITVIE